MDQTFWQSTVAAKPGQGAWGFLTAGLLWFAIPFSFATTVGGAYIALSAQQGEALLSGDDVTAGKNICKINNTRRTAYITRCPNGSDVVISKIKKYGQIRFFMGDYLVVWAT